MAVTIDATSSSTGAAGTTLTYAHTVGSGSNRELIVFIGLDDAGAAFPSGVTFDGVAMTNLGGAGGVNNPLVADAWYLLAPNVGAHNIVITKASGIPIASSGISLFGAATPTNSNTGQADAAVAASLGLTAATAGLALDCIVTSLAAPTVNASQTAFGAAANFSGTKDFSSSYKLVAAGSPTMDWSFLLNDYIQGGVFVPQAASTSGFFTFM